MNYAEKVKESKTAYPEHVQEIVMSDDNLDLLNESLTCYYCGRAFKTHQTLHAHMRFCKEREFSRRPEGWF